MTSHDPTSVAKRIYLGLINRERGSASRPPRVFVSRFTIDIRSRLASCKNKTIHLNSTLLEEFAEANSRQIDMTQYLRTSPTPISYEEHEELEVEPEALSIPTFDRRQAIHFAFSAIAIHDNAANLYYGWNRGFVEANALTSSEWGRGQLCQLSWDGEHWHIVEEVVIWMA